MAPHIFNFISKSTYQVGWNHWLALAEIWVFDSGVKYESIDSDVEEVANGSAVGLGTRFRF